MEARHSSIVPDHNFTILICLPASVHASAGLEFLENLHYTAGLVTESFHWTRNIILQNLNCVGLRVVYNCFAVRRGLKIRELNCTLSHQISYKYVLLEH